MHLYCISHKTHYILHVKHYIYMLHVIKVNVKEDINLRVGDMGRVTEGLSERLKKREEESDIITF